VDDARLADIVRSSYDAIVGETLEGVVTVWNRAAEHLYGYGAAEILGQRADRLYPPGYRAEEAAILRQVARGGWPAGYVTERIRRDGSTATVSVSASPVADGGGATVGVASASRAVAAPGRGAGPAAAPDAILGVDPTGRITLVNAPAAGLLGRSREDLIGCLLEAVVPGVPARGDPPPPSPDAGRHLVARRGDGTGVAVEAASPATGAGDGDLLLLLTPVAAHRTPDTLTAGTSHNLRTPLQAIIGFSGTLLLRLPGPLTDEQEYQLRLVQASAEQLLSLINDLSRPGGG
jgi:protein-histidine pros-kinase